MKTFFLFLSLLALGWTMSCSNSKKSLNTAESNMDIFSLHPSNYQSDFVAIARDSSWKLAIVFDKTIVFTSKTDNIVFQSTEATPSIAAGADILSFSSQNKGATLTVSIDVATCQGDGKKVRVLYTDEKAGKTIEYEACGHYTGDARLFSLWSLTHIDGEPIDATIFRRQPPFFQFNTEDQKVGGSGGCNTFGATVRFEYNALYMDALIATRMYCEVESKIEQQVFERVQDIKVIYTIKDNQLTLESQKGSLTFSKAD